MHGPTITSTSNDKIKHVRALQSRAKARREAGQFVVEGVRLAEEALSAGVQPSLALYTAELNERGMALIARLQASDTAVEQVTPEVLAAASDTETPQGILLVLPMPEEPRTTTLDLVLVVDQLRDPGNLGTLLRTAAAAAVQRVLLLPGSVDAYSPKALRAGMGAHFQLDIAAIEVDALPPLLETHGLTLCLAEADGGVHYDQFDMRRPIALAVGGEAEGPSRALRQLPHTTLAIPMPGAAESLNAGVAGSVLLIEALRQRRSPETHA